MALFNCVDEAQSAVTQTVSLRRGFAQKWALLRSPPLRKRRGEELRYTLVMPRTALLVTLLLWSAATTQTQQQSTPTQPQIQKPPHQRITKTEATGNRYELASLKGASLFTSPSLNPAKPVPLLVHFHGTPWLIETHVARHLPKAALITVQLGAGSSAYRRPFENPDLFRELINEAAQTLSLKRGWSSVTLTGFSAGYGGVREILRRPEYFALVDNVLLLDGLHASYGDEAQSPSRTGSS